MTRRKTAAPKMADIARLAGVHVSTVSRALAGSPLVEREMRERILEIASKHGYVVNRAARNLRTSRTQTLSVVIPLAHERNQPSRIRSSRACWDFWPTRSRGGALACISRRFFRRCTVGCRTHRVTPLGRHHRHRSKHGACRARAGRRYVCAARRLGRPLREAELLRGRNGQRRRRADATEHLLASGRRRIVFVGDPSIPEIRLRCNGYKLALKRAPRGSAGPRVIKAHMTPEAAHAAMRGFIESGVKFDAVFAATDIIAISTMRAIAAAGLAVPRSVAVVGFDDIAMAAHVHPSLTTVHQDLVRGASLLVDLLLRRAAGEKDRVGRLARRARRARVERRIVVAPAAKSMRRGVVGVVPARKPRARPDRTLG